MSFPADNKKQCMACDVWFPTAADCSAHNSFNCKGRNPPPPVVVNITSVPAEMEFLIKAKNSGLSLADARSFIEAGGNANCLDGMGRNALFYIAYQEPNGTVEDGVAAYLIEKGADVNIKDICHDPPIFYAYTKKAYKLWKALYEGGAEPGIYYIFDLNDPFVFPVRPGVVKGNPEASEKMRVGTMNQHIGMIIDALLDGADPDYQDGNDPALVQTLRCKGVTPIAYVLVAYGADVTKMGMYYSALTFCMNSNNQEFYEFMCKARGIEPNWEEFRSTYNDSCEAQAKFLKSVAHIPMCGRKRRH